MSAVIDLLVWFVVAVALLWVFWNIFDAFKADEDESEWKFDPEDFD